MWKSWCLKAAAVWGLRLGATLHVIHTGDLSFLIRMDIGIWYPPPTFTEFV